jgi:hypothetical protein
MTVNQESLWSARRHIDVALFDLGRARQLLSESACAGWWYEPLERLSNDLDQLRRVAAIVDRLLSGAGA